MKTAKEVMEALYESDNWSEWVADYEEVIYKALNLLAAQEVKT